MKISIITPSLNQGQFIERTILSVLNQHGNFELEYIIVDGGSTDDTLEIVRKYEDRLTLVSGRDRGQSEAINKGFRMASGTILAWLNSDDTYEPGALSEVVERFKNHACEWCFGNCRNIDENDREIRRLITRYKIFESRRYSLRRLLSKDFISQPAVFFSRRVFQEVGPLDLDLEYTMDYDYWLRIGKKFTPLYIERFLANFRWHEHSKNGANYRKSAHEAYLVAKKHATNGDGYQILRHYIHYVTLSMVYWFLCAAPYEGVVIRK
ncbi:MAG TPA: glycosyltransferase family 2 protein [Syntrophales bacterium]|nr:glycosyltransferase family 2 protein [Syntrophales bacterium]HPQ43701.1 glycosyltransferase family 2 protein [Syntrophales bacterium]